LDRRDRKVALEIAHVLLTPNLVYNRQETLNRRQKAKDAVLPVQISIQKNQTIVAAGSVVQPLQMALVNQLNSLRSSKRADFVSVIVAFLFMILLTTFFSYLRRTANYRINVTLKDVYAMGSVVLLVVLMTKVYLFITDAAFSKSQVIPANS